MNNRESKKADRKAYKRDWARRWRKNNPDKEKANQERYWARRLGLQPAVSVRSIEN